jgi:alpha-glucosidase
MRLIEIDGGFDLVLADRTLLRHRTGAPCAFIGRGEPDIAMGRGHFAIADYVTARVPLTHAVIARDEQGAVIALAAGPGEPAALEIRLLDSGDQLVLRPHAADPTINRLWFRVPAAADEHVWGGGEQMSYFNLRGRRFPMWTSEPGVGRDKSTLITFQADQRNHGGGDYYTTYYPQPTFISSLRYALHVETTAYSAFDFRHADFHEIEVWAVPDEIVLWTRDSFAGLVSALSERFGRQPPLPAWVLGGAIVGLKEGARSYERLDGFIAAGAAISGLWCEDWVGVRETSFGTRLFWDWTWNPDRYPGLDTKIAELGARSVRFLGYINPYLSVDGSLYPQAAAAGHLVLRPDAETPYLIDFGEFECGMVDFTNPAAASWYEEEVIGRNMIDFGLSGWMADFGEYLPHDARLNSGVDGLVAHNAWPTLWGKVNAEAIASRGKTGEILFFMRAGFTGVQAYCPLLWAGDQSVDFSRHDGLQTVICAALSSGLMGNAYHHSDIGGYTSLFGNVRTAELLQRWSEMAAFTAVMRSHEGNRPRQNLQLDEDPQVLAHFARMTRVYRHLAPYLAELSAEAAATGLPVQRPLFLHFEADRRTWDIQTAYLYGPDLLVAPVVEAGVAARQVYLPAGADWVHVWSGRTHAGGQEIEAPAPIGEPAVYYRKGSPHADLFAGLAGV